MPTVRQRYSRIALAVLVVTIAVLGWWFTRGPHSVDCSFPLSMAHITFDDWAAFGDTRGYVEPCGCNPETDLGGLQRLQAWIQKDKKVSNRPIFCLGGMYPADSKVPENLGKVNFVSSFLSLQAQKSPQVLPCLVGRTEWDARDQLGDSLNGFLLSNQSQQNPMFKEYLRLSNALVFGFLEDSELKLAGNELLDGWKASVRGSRPETKKILLFSGSDGALAFFEGSEWFDLIISSNTSPLDAEPDKKEKEKPGRLLRSASTYMVPSFGQGVLQSVKKPSSAASATQPSEATEPLDGNSMVFADLRSPVLWLGKDDVAELGPDDPVAGLYKKYNDTQGDLFELWMGSRQADSESSSFAGAESCKSCHADAYKVWANSKHAHAFATLEGKSKDQDLECISCHVVGFDSKDGFPATGKGDWKDSQLKNVQCENCHGPRKDHVANPTIKSAAPDAKAVCVSCHHTPHSTDFNFDERWKKIAHGHSK